MFKTQSTKIVAVALAVLLVLATSPVGAAQPAPALGESGMIVAFAPLDTESVSVTLGTEESALPLPQTLTATVRGPEVATPSEPVEESEIEVAVSWQSEPEYDHETPGEYVFTAEVEGEYDIATELPTFTVTVEGEAEDDEKDTATDGGLDGNEEDTATEGNLDGGEPPTLEVVVPENVPVQPMAAFTVSTYDDLFNAISSGTEDPRFPPVTPEELGELVYSVDVLSPPEPCDEHMLDPVKYGVIVTSGAKRGLLLPHLEGVDTVAVQLAIAKRKAGIIDGEPVGLERFTVARHK